MGTILGFAKMKSTAGYYRDDSKLAFFSSFWYFFFFFWRQAIETRGPRPYGQGWRFLASKGKRDKYSQETNRFRTCRFAVFCIVNQKYQKKNS
jgi:hypothetical protein